MALRRETGCDPDGAAEAVMIHGFERGTTLGAWVGVSRTGQHKRCTHVDVTELGRASLGLGLHHNQPHKSEQQRGSGNEGNNRLNGCHDSKLVAVVFLFKCAILHGFLHPFIALLDGEVFA